MIDRETNSPALALIVGAARSGTTLTRLLLDAHPDVGCPSEAGLPALMEHLARVWWMVNADDVRLPTTIRDPGEAHREGAAPTDGWPDQTLTGAPDLEPVAPQDLARQHLPQAAREWIVNTVHEPMAGYCGPRSKRLYCDKSLDSVHHLDLVRDLFPEVRVVLVFRHVMDTIASGLEASPWGFNAYGYGPYVQATPGNTVAALAAYWLDHVDRALAWESKHPDSCHRVRYEDLVSRPDEVIVDVQRFLGVPEDLSVLERAFDRNPARGPGDYKAEYTTSVHAQSVGRGKRIPVGLLPQGLRKLVNEKLALLEYAHLDLGWNAGERAVDGAGQGRSAELLRSLMHSLRLPTHAVHRAPFAVVADDHRILRWVIDPELQTVEVGDGEVEAVLTGTAEDLVAMLTAEENLGVLLRSGRLRYVVADAASADEAVRRSAAGEIRQVVDLLRVAAAAGNGVDLADADRANSDFTR